MAFERGNEVRFLLLGDWGRRGDAVQREGACAMADTAARAGATS